MRYPTTNLIRSALILMWLLVGPGLASAQTFSDPVMRTLRVVATCNGPAGSSGAVELHFHAFGSAKVGPPREIPPSPMRCTSEEPATEAEIFLAVPAIWHAYIRVPDGDSATLSEICEVEGSDLPAVSR